MGSDLAVVNAARVSFHKESDWEAVLQLSEKDEKLIGFLARNGHWSPFAHTGATFRINAPIFVARQLVKHQVGLVWNEVSRRYVDDEPVFYIPEVWRGKPINAKQGSSDEVVSLITVVDPTPAVAEPLHIAYTGDPSSFAGVVCNAALATYQGMIKDGVAPEQARMVLPLNTMTEWWWTGSVMAFARVCKQRMDPHAQQECREVAEQIDKLIQPIFPVSWKALNA